MLSFNAGRVLGLLDADAAAATHASNESKANRIMGLLRFRATTDDGAGTARAEFTHLAAQVGSQFTVDRLNLS
jgi:hypothetical protein